MTSSWTPTPSLFLNPQEIPKNQIKKGLPDCRQPPSIYME